MAYDKAKAHEYYIKYRKKGLKKGRRRRKDVINPTGNNSLDDRVRSYLGKTAGAMSSKKLSKEDKKKQSAIRKAYKQVQKKRSDIIKQQEKADKKRAAAQEKAAKKQAAAAQKQAQAQAKAAQRKAAQDKKKKEQAKKKLQTQKNSAKLKTVSTPNLNADGKAKAKVIAQNLQNEFHNKVAKAKDEKQIAKLKKEYEGKLQKEMQKLNSDPALQKGAKTASETKKAQTKQTIDQTQAQAQAVVDAVMKKLSDMSDAEKKQTKDNLKVAVDQIQELYDRLKARGA